MNLVSQLIESKSLNVPNLFAWCYFIVFISLKPQVLKNEFPKGVDIVYESVGGDMLDLCLNALTTYGRLVVIGMISQVWTFDSNTYLSFCICHYLYVS